MVAVHRHVPLLQGGIYVVAWHAILFFFVAVFFTAPAFASFVVTESPVTLFHQIEEGKKTDDLEKQKKAYEKLLIIDPNNRSYYISLCRILESQENYILAREYYRRYLVRYPDDIDIRFLSAYTFYKEQKYDIAEEELLLLLEVDPDYLDAKLGLARIYRIKKEKEKALLLLDQVVKEDPFYYEAFLLRGDIEVSQGAYSKGYTDYAKVYYNNGDKKALDKMIGIAQLVYPSFSTTGLFSKETEQDLILKINTVTLNTWESSSRLFFPINDAVDLFYLFRFSPIQQKNLQLGVNNYYMNTYSGGIGVESSFRPEFLIRGQTAWSWGKDKGEVVFPFGGPFVWEPTLTFQYRPQYMRIGSTLGKDHIIGRSIASQQSFFVRRRFLDAFIEYPFGELPSALGANGELSIYNDTSSNRKKEISPFVRVSLPNIPFRLFGEFRFRYGTFGVISQNYYSYRRRQEVISQVTLQKDVGARFLAEAIYQFGWNKVSDFSNIAEAIVPGAPVSEVIKQNIYKSSRVELHLKKVQQDRLTFDLFWKYYIDTNNYRSNVFQGSLLYIF